MSAHCIENAEGIEVPSVMAGTHLKLGARKEGARIFFSVIAPSADTVYLVGDFNEWRESHPMRQMSAGHWCAELCAEMISDGDRYKFKIYIGDEAIYVADPYARENDGEPDHNSVYRDMLDESAVRICSSGSDPRDDSPLMVYSVRADKWCRDKRGRAFDFHTFGRELLPYVLQMGYTHVAISGYAEEYYDHGSSSHTKAYFVPRASQGGRSAIMTFIRELHSLDIGVLLELDLKKSFGNIDDDLDFYTEAAVYLHRSLGADGFVMVDGFGRNAEFFSRLVHNIKTETENAVLVLPGLEGECTSGAISVKTPECGLPHFKVTQDAMKYLCAKASAMTLLLFEECRMLTRMGEETAQGYDIGVRFDPNVGGSYANARFQIFCSELNRACMSHYRAYDSLTTLSLENIGDVRVLKRENDERELAVAADLSGHGSEITVTGENWELILDSCNTLGMWGGARLKQEHGETRLTLPPYGSAVIIKEKLFRI